MLQAGVRQPESKGGDAPDGQGANPPHRRRPTPWRETLSPLAPPTPRGGTLDIRRPLQTRRGPDRNVQEKEASRSPGGGRLRQAVPRPPRGVAGALGPRAHSPSARPWAALTAARKRSICVFPLPSGSHMTWHPRISSCPARNSLDMAAAEAARGPGQARDSGGRGRGGGPGASGWTNECSGAVAGERHLASPAPAPPSAPPRPRVTLGGRRAEPPGGGPKLAGLGGLRRPGRRAVTWSSQGLKRPREPGAGSPRPPARTGVHSFSDLF